MRRGWGWGWVLVAAVLIGSSWLGLVRAGDPELINLLTHPETTLEPIPGSPPDMNALADLIDGNANTSLTMPVKPKTTLKLLFAFGGKQIALQKISIITGTGRKIPVRYDLLVSNASPHTGYQSVRSDPLKPGVSAQEFTFAPVGAKWVILRLTPTEGAEEISLADVKLVGHLGPPATLYSFKESPAKAFDVLRRLEKIRNLKLSVSRDEASLFEDASDGKLEHWSFEEAALLSCGVRGKSKRQPYMDRLDVLEAEARKAIEGERTPFGKGRALLKYLHAGPMSKGYVEGHTDLTTVLDEGTFNCVSSATLYAILGRRLGLDVRAIEVPKHAFAIIYDGTKHADVETTTDQGFDPARDEQAQQELSKVTGFTYIPDSYRDQRREVNDIGLVAINCLNHGITAIKDKQYEQALMAFFRAISLDAQNGSAVKSVLGVLANWAKELADANQFEEAIEVLKAGLELAPSDALLNNNHLATWQQWAMALSKAGKDDDAVAVLRLAAKAIPQGGFIEMQSWVVVSRGEELVKAGKYAEALTLVAPGLKKIDAGAHASVNEWASSVYDHWARSLSDKGDWQGAVNVYVKGVKRFPNDSRLAHNRLATWQQWAHGLMDKQDWEGSLDVLRKGRTELGAAEFDGNIVYVLQQWVLTLHTQQGTEAAEKVLKAQLEQLKEVKDVRKVALSYAHHLVTELAKKGALDEALEAVARLETLINNADESNSLAGMACDEIAQKLIKEKKWAEAIDVYSRGLKKFPKSGHVHQNAVATWYQWAETFAEAKDFAGAIKVYEEALQNFPDEGVFKQNLNYYQEQLKKA